MSIDFSSFTDLEAAMYRDEQQRQHQHQQPQQPHPHFNGFDDPLAYSSFGNEHGVAATQPSYVPRYGQATVHQQQQYGYNEYMYAPPPQPQPLYPDHQTLASSFDVLGGPPQPQSQQQQQQTPYASAPPAQQNGYGAPPPQHNGYGAPSAYSNGHGHGHSAYGDVLMPASSADHRRGAMTAQGFAPDSYGLALPAALSSASMGPSPLSQYQDRSSYVPPPPPPQQHVQQTDVNAYAQQTQQQQATAQGTDTPSPYSQMRFSNSPPHDHGSVSSPLNLSVNEELAKLNIHTSASPTPDLVTFMRPYLEQYVNAPNRLAFGERTLIVMSSKVAQKSYGTEKRFLCPPPTAVLIGNEWWSEIALPGNDHGKILPPRVIVSISGEPTPPECSVDWISGSGKSFDPTDPPPRDQTTFIGRAVGKQLFISEVDEKKKKVEALVHVTAPAVDDGPERVIGIFKSRPIKVISKPSKKRQSAKNLELCINHGSTIALFHRLRAQTVSTKYLCVSGSGTAFKGSDGAPLQETLVHRSFSPSFIAQTTSWDSFIMYIVDVNKPSAATDTVPPPSPIAGYPSPPPNAIQFSNNNPHIPIYYNQTVVLQCLTSGVVSPVLIIRKVDHSTTVVGGGAQDTTKNVPDSYCAPGEVCGDPVSQLHKIAFEVYDASKAGAEPGKPGLSSPFLACVGEKVNTHHPEETRTWNSPVQASPGSQSPSLPGSPIVSTPTSATSAAGEHFNGSGDDAFPSADGGRVRRKRNSTSREGRAPTATKGRRPRQSSTGSNRGGSGGEGPQTGTQASGALWSIDVGETSIWTIVGTDQVRYNFYVPPALFEPGAPAQPYVRPVPTKMVTPFPDVVKYLPPDRVASQDPTKCGSMRALLSSQPHEQRMLTVYGANFSKTDPVSVFFGADPSPHVEVRCTEVLACLPPDDTPVPTSSKPMLLVRSDGVVFPSNCMYP